MVPASFARTILEHLPPGAWETGRPDEASSHDASGAAVHPHVSPAAPTAARTMDGPKLGTPHCARCGQNGHRTTPDALGRGGCPYPPCPKCGLAMWDFESCDCSTSADRPPAVADRQASQPAAPVTASAPVAGAPPRNHQIGEITRMTTTKTLLDRVALDTSGLDDLVADIEVPALSTPQRQGDVGIFPRDPLTTAERSQCDAVPGTGVAVVRGESTGGNAHILLADGPVMFGRRDAGVLIGILDVPEESTAHLIHTEEHSAISIAPGTYRVHGKREQADEIRRVAD